MKIEAVDQSEIEMFEFAEDSEPDNLDEAGPSTSVNPAKSSKLLDNSSHVHSPSFS